MYMAESQLVQRVVDVQVRQPIRLLLQASHTVLFTLTYPLLQGQEFADNVRKVFAGQAVQLFGNPTQEPHSGLQAEHVLTPES